MATEVFGENIFNIVLARAINHCMLSTNFLVFAQWIINNIEFKIKQIKGNKKSRFNHNLDILYTRGDICFCHWINHAHFYKKLN